MGERKTTATQFLQLCTICLMQLDLWAGLYLEAEGNAKPIESVLESQLLLHERTWRSYTWVQVPVGCEYADAPSIIGVFSRIY